MKTKELIKRVELMGYGAEEIKSITFGEVRIFHNGYECATVDTCDFLSLDTQHGSYYELEESERESLYNILDEYIRTPVEERVEEEKYIYRFPGVDKDNGYINLNTTRENIFIASKANVINGLKTQFTQSDIDKLTPNQQNLFAIAIKERVE